MEKLSQYLNFRDSDQRLWHTIEGGNEIQQVNEDDYDQSKPSKHMCFYNAEFSEGMRACV